MVAASLFGFGGNFENENSRGGEAQKNGSPLRPQNMDERVAGWPCIYCNTSSDRLTHLVVCPKLWDLVWTSLTPYGFRLGIPIPNQISYIDPEPSDVLAQLGLSSDAGKQTARFLALHIALEAYQTCRDSDCPNSLSVFREVVRYTAMRLSKTTNPALHVSSSHPSSVSDLSSPPSRPTPVPTTLVASDSTPNPIHFAGFAPGRRLESD